MPEIIDGKQRRAAVAVLCSVPFLLISAHWAEQISASQKTSDYITGKEKRFGVKSHCWAFFHAVIAIWDGAVTGLCAKSLLIHCRCYNERHQTCTVIHASISQDLCNTFSFPKDLKMFYKLIYKLPTRKAIHPSRKHNYSPRQSRTTVWIHTHKEKNFSKWRKYSPVKAVRKILSIQYVSIQDLERIFLL